MQEAAAQEQHHVLAGSLTTTAIIIDGKLTEPEWSTADTASSFTQNTPMPGAPSTQRTKVRVLYDNTAIYVGAIMYDAHPDSILTQLSARDDYGNNNDAFGVMFDTYCDKQNGSQFIVTAAGVQVDAVLQFDNSDFSWNAAWYSRVSITDSGWCVEMKIPYAALRFPKKADQQWGINFMRIIRRIRERSYWNNVQPNVSNIINQCGRLTGLHDIEAPVRLTLLPYASAYGEYYDGSKAHSFNGGMDIKYGFNESFTLDLTLVPDFGQTLYDNRVLNLSPIEVRYDERRYFFTEGLTLFNKDDLFYTRRVGGTPISYYDVYNNVSNREIVTDNPLTARHTMRQRSPGELVETLVWDFSMQYPHLPTLR
jgi:hypothetical protein